MYLPAWMDGLTPEMVKKAEAELDETPEKMKKALNDLKRLLAGMCQWILQRLLQLRESERSTFYLLWETNLPLLPLVIIILIIVFCIVLQGQTFFA